MELAEVLTRMAGITDLSMKLLTFLIAKNIDAKAIEALFDNIANGQTLDAAIIAEYKTAALQRRKAIEKF